MKKLLSSVTLIAGLLLAGNLFAQAPASATTPAGSSADPAAAPDPNAPVMKFEKDTIDYGTIPRNSDGYRIFKFTNTGKEPLLIKEAHGSCGCTVPTYSSEPIAPGQQSEIKVHYATDRPNGFTKTVTINSNANPSQKILVIKGYVIPDPPAPAATTPASASPVVPTAPTTTAH